MCEEKIPEAFAAITFPNMILLGSIPPDEKGVGPLTKKNHEFPRFYIPPFND